MKGGGKSQNLITLSSRTYNFIHGFTLHTYILSIA